MMFPAVVPLLGFVRAIAVEANGQLVVVDSNLDAVLRVDPLTGNRTIVSDAATGRGTAFVNPTNIAVEADGQLVVVDDALATIFRGDPSTGNRTIISNFETGNGPIMLGDRDLVVEATGRLVVLDASPARNAVYRVDPATGDRTIIFDDVIGGGVTFGQVLAIALEASPTAQTVTVQIDSTFAEPGDSVKIPIRLVNETNINVSGLQFDIDLGGVANAAFVELAEDMTPPGFQVDANLVNGILKVVVFSTSGDSIPPGDKILEKLCFVVQENPPLPGVLETESSLVLLEPSIEVSDQLGAEIGSSGEDGVLQVGVPGDLNLDGEASIRDVVLLVRELIGKDGDALPPPRTVADVIRDVTPDGTINVADVIGQVGMILGLPPVPSAKLLAYGPVRVSLDMAQTLDDGQVISVRLNTRHMIAGAQMTFTFDPTTMKIGTPQLVGDVPGLAFDSAVKDGTLRVVVYSLAVNLGLATGRTPVLLIPVTLADDLSADLTLSEILLVDKYTQRVPVTLGRHLS